MKRVPGLKRVVAGAVVGLVAAVVFQLTEPIASLPESINLIHVLSTLAVIIPGIVASLVNWDLFVVVTVIYGASVGLLFGRFPQRSRLLALLLLLVHFLGLAFVDFVMPQLLKLPVPF